MSQSSCVFVLYDKSLSCVRLCDPLDCSPPGSSVHGILQARILEWVAMSCSRGVFPTQGSNQCLSRLLYLQAGSLPLAPPVAAPLPSYLLQPQSTPDPLSPYLHQWEIAYFSFSSSLLIFWGYCQGTLGRGTAQRKGQIN